MSITIETLRTDRFCMRWFRFGSGSRVFVILPGLSVKSVMNDADAIAEDYAAFTAEYTVCVFDRREDPPNAYSVRDMAHDTAQAMKELGLSGVCLFGASQGGMIAQVIAAEYPELVGKLVLGSTTSRVAAYEPVIEHWIRLAEERDGTGLFADFGRKIYPADVYEQVREQLHEAGKTVTEEEFRRFLIYAKGMRGFDISGELNSIRCPVLVMGAYEDAVLDTDDTMEIAELLDLPPKDHVYLYKGYGHAAFSTAPDYKQRILSFLKM